MQTLNQQFFITFGNAKEHSRSMPTQKSDTVLSFSYIHKYTP